MHQLKPVGDAASVGGIIAILVGWLPSITTFFSFLTAILAFAWWLIRLYETKSIQRWLGRNPEGAGE
jgi:uncharacterized membrane protein